MSRAPVFLDRDGTVIVEKEYLEDPDAVALEAGAATGLSLLQAHGHPLIILSNQSGIGRGMFTEAQARRVNERVAELLRRDGIHLVAWYMCPHAPDMACDCRKPLPGMALAAARDHGVVLQGSYVIGDKRSDLELADAIGGTGVLVTSGHGREAVGWAREGSRPVFDGLRDAAEYIVALDQE